jgi:fumarate reductase (CoM/CoB) subunit A
MRTLSTDVVIVGSGGAGLYAAVKAAEAGAKVTLVEKGLVGRSGSTVGSAGLTAVGSWGVAGDSQEVHYQDTLASGQHINNQKLVRILVAEVSQRVRELERWGLTFDRRADGSYFLDHVSGHSYARALARSDLVGLVLIKTLRTKALQLKVDFQQDSFVTSLLSRDGRVIGLTAIESRSGELLVFEGKAVVLATGAIGQLYPVTSNTVQATGDGQALALRAGAEMVDMEQFQFFPAGVVYPESLKGFGLGTVEYSKLYNGQGERFMTRYAPDTMERSTRDLLAQAIYSEIRAGRGTAHGGVYLDVRDVPDEVFKNFTHEYELCLERGLDLKESRVEAAPTAHYFMGGIRINENCETTLAGLYAAGEVTGGVMGANRLSGNSLADITVFGAIAGERAAGYARHTKHVAIDQAEADREYRRISDLVSSARTEKTPNDLKREMREVMWDKVGVIRSEESLNAALVDLKGLESELPKVGIQQHDWKYNLELIAYLEAENMLLVGQAIANSALVRKESRGAHYMEDYPEKDDVHWLRSITTKLEGGSIKTYTQPLVTE